jgi:hypothetical protein
MKSKLSRILKDLRAQRESIYGRRFAIQSTPLDSMRLAKRNLAQSPAFNAQSTRFLSMNFFGPTSNELVDVCKKGRQCGLDGMIETIYHLSITGR